MASKDQIEQMRQHLAAAQAVLDDPVSALPEWASSLIADTKSLPSDLKEAIGSIMPEWAHKLASPWEHEDQEIPVAAHAPDMGPPIPVAAHAPPTAEHAPQLPEASFAPDRDQTKREKLLAERVKQAQGFAQFWRDKAEQETDDKKRQYQESQAEIYEKSEQKESGRLEKMSALADRQHAAKNAPQLPENGISGEAIGSGPRLPMVSGGAGSLAEGRLPGGDETFGNAPGGESKSNESLMATIKELTETIKKMNEREEKRERQGSAGKPNSIKEKFIANPKSALELLQKTMADREAKKEAAASAGNGMMNRMDGGTRTGSATPGGAAVAAGASKIGKSSDPASLPSAR